MYQKIYSWKGISFSLQYGQKLQASCALPSLNPDPIPSHASLETYNCLVEPDWEIAGGLLLDLSSGLESFWVSPKYHTTPSLKLEASQSLKCDGSLTLRSSQTSKPMKLSFLGYRKKNCCNSGCKFFWLSLTYCRLEKLLDSSSSSSLSRSILCLFSGISCVFATCVAVYNYKTTMFQSKRKKKSIIENEWIVAEAKETFKEVL